MRRILGLLLIPALLIGLVWLVAVIYLQQTQTDVNGSALLGWFVVAPLGLIGVWLGGKALLGWYKQPAPPAAQTTVAQASVANNVPPQQAKAQPLAILSAEVLTCSGEDSAQQLSEIRDGTLMPELSSTYVDSNGLPLFAALHPELDLDEARPWLQRWLSAAPADHAAHQEDPEYGTRLLSLLASPLSRSLNTLSDLAPPRALEGARSDVAQEPRPIHLKLFAPTAWQDMLIAYVREQIAPLQGFALGVIRPNPQRPDLQHDAIRIADAFSTDTQQARPDRLLLMLACDSLGCETQIERLAQQGQLFTPQQQAGLVPGEAAVSVLAMAASHTTPETEVVARFSRSAWGARQKPVDAGGRGEADLLGELLPGLLREDDGSNSEIHGLVSDCDQRPAWNAESAILISAHFPELDPIADHLALGRALGSTGHASSLLALAMAALHARDEEQTVLNASLADPVQRSLALLRPWQASLT